MAEATKKPRKTLSEEVSMRPNKSQSPTGFYLLARAKRDKRMRVRYRAGLLSAGLLSNNSVAVLLCLVLRLLDIWPC